jgi:hypothetical protein
MCKQNQYAPYPGLADCFDCPHINARSNETNGTGCRCVPDYWSRTDVVIGDYCEQCQQKGRCAGGRSCERGYAKYRCTACAKNFYRVSDNCYQCPDYPFVE